jgi:hypothetical protein
MITQLRTGRDRLAEGSARYDLRGRRNWRSYALVEDVYDFGRESPPRPRFAGLSELIYYDADAAQCQALDDAAQCQALDANSVRFAVLGGHLRRSWTHDEGSRPAFDDDR